MTGHSAQRVKELKDVAAELHADMTFLGCLDLWMQLQLEAIKAKHKADIEYAIAYEKASNQVNQSGKPLTEKAKDNQAFMDTEEHAFAAQLADLRAKSVYNLMLKMRDESGPQHIAELIKEAYKR